MRGYDVGGSHKSQQTGYESFGIRRQNRILADGVDTTEGESGTGFYFDYYSIEEFTTSAAGADVEMTGPGSMVVMTMKSGGNEFSGLLHGDYEHESFVGNNVDSELEARNFTGNPNILFWEAHADLGGPIVEDRAWFYGFYNHFRIDKQISGVDPNLATDLGDFDQFGGKITAQLTNQDQLIAYTNYQLKEKPQRGLSNTVGPDSVLAQASWSWAHKGEWQRVWDDRTFSTLAVKHFGFGWPMVPQVDPESNPPRFDQATGIHTGAGWNTNITGTPPFTFERWKPQVTATVSHYVPDFLGSHDFKFGYDFQIDSRKFGANSNSGHVRYIDDSTQGRPHGVDQIALFSMPADGQINADSRNTHHDLFAQDTWRPHARLTLNIGVRFGQQRTHFLDSESNPLFADFFPTGVTQGQTLVTWNTWAPRLGATYEIADGTVLKGHYGRYYVNLADAHRRADPANVAWVRFDFLDQNANGLYDGAQELGTLRAESGATGTAIRTLGTPVNPDLAKEYVDEFSVSFEHEVVTDTALRASYVRKHLNGDSGQWNVPQQLALLDGRGIPCGTDFDCPINALTGAPINVQRVPDDVANVVNIQTDTFPGIEATYDTIQFAANRRFAGGFFVQASFDYQWRDEFRSASGESRSPLTADPIDVGTDGHGTVWQNHSLDVDFRQETTNWNGRLLARYSFPYGIAVSGQRALPERLAVGADSARVHSRFGHPAGVPDEPEREPFGRRDHRGLPYRKGLRSRERSARDRDGGRVQRVQLERGVQLQPAHRIELQQRDRRNRSARRQGRPATDLLTQRSWWAAARRPPGLRPPRGWRPPLATGDTECETTAVPAQYRWPQTPPPPAADRNGHPSSEQPRPSSPCSSFPPASPPSVGSPFRHPSPRSALQRMSELATQVVAGTIEKMESQPGITTIRASTPG